MTSEPPKLDDQPPASPRRRGLTLVEVMFSVVIMATMMAAALGTVGAAAKSRLAQRDSAVGLPLARQLLSEIVQTRYADLVDPVFGIEAGETRATFDDVDDYDGLTEANAQYANGTAIPGGTGWQRKVKVEWVTPADPTVTSVTTTGLKRITVTVTSPGGKTFAVTALRSAADGYENTPGSQVTYTCWAGVSLRVGDSENARSVQGTNLLNLIP